MTPEETLKDFGINSETKFHNYEYLFKSIVLAMDKYASQFYSEEQVREAFNKGRFWAETYSGWYEPSERDHLNRQNKCINDLKSAEQPVK